MEVKSSKADSTDQLSAVELPHGYAGVDQLPARCEKKVLFIDKNPLVLSTVHDLLTRQGIICLKANRTLEALFLIARSKPDIVFVEAGTAKIEGLWLWELLETQGDYEGIFWVMVTSEQCESEHYTATHADIDAILVKPFGSRELTGLINKAYEDIQGLA